MVARAAVCEMLLDQGEGDSPAAPDFLLLLPKLLWPAEPGLNGKRHEKNVQRRLAWAHQGRWAELMREALARPASQLPTHEPADAFAEGGLSPETARRLYRAAATGQLGKAWKPGTACPAGTTAHPSPSGLREARWRHQTHFDRHHLGQGPQSPALARGTARPATLPGAQAIWGRHSTAWPHDAASHTGTS